MHRREKVCGLNFHNIRSYFSPAEKSSNKSFIHAKIAYIVSIPNTNSKIIFR